MALTAQLSSQIFNRENPENREFAPGWHRKSVEYSDGGKSGQLCDWLRPAWNGAVGI